MGDNRYKCWEQMRSRCNNPNATQYKDYGGRGITVCKRWDSFKRFCDDMGARPRGFTIERTNNTLGYAPDNCRWASRKEQANNTRRNRIVEYKGQCLTLSQWQEVTGIPQKDLSYRLIAGWSVKRALTTPSMSKPERLITHKGTTLNVTQWGRHLNLARKTISNRLDRGLAIADALAT